MSQHNGSRPGSASQRSSGHGGISTLLGSLAQHSANSPGPSRARLCSGESGALDRRRPHPGPRSSLSDKGLQLIPAQGRTEPRPQAGPASISPSYQQNKSSLLSSKPAFQPSRARTPALRMALRSSSCSSSSCSPPSGWLHALPPAP